MLQKIRVKVNTPEWLEVKQNYIGCSDIPVLTGSSQYSSPLNIFYQKIDLKSPHSEMTERPYMGHLHEPLILELWEYFDGKNREAYVQNHMAKRQLRKLIHNDGFILVNPDFPFLSTTPDGIIPAGQPTLHGEILEKDSPVNAKNVDSLVWNQYEGFHPAHQEQMHGEMTVFGTEYSELASLVGGNEFHVDPVEFNSGIQQAIIGICRSFWYDRVLPAQPLAKRWKIANGTKEKDAIMKDIMALEPPPDASESYRSFLSQRFQDRDNPEKRVQASPDIEKMINWYQYYSDIEKEIKNNKNLIKNTLLKIHEHNRYTHILGNECKSVMGKRHNISGVSREPREIKRIVNNLKP